MRKLLAVTLIALLGSTTLTACDFAVAGRRCVVGSEAHRDANYVLFCVRGRWKRVLTIQQAAQFVVGNLPGGITASSPTVIARAGFAPNSLLKFVATKRNGSVLANAKVTLSAPTAGASLQVASITQETGEDGSVVFGFSVANGTVGSYQVTATIDGTNLAASMTITNVAGPASSISVVSGAGQTTTASSTYAQPVVVKVVDSYGTPVAGQIVSFTRLNPFQFSPQQATTDADGTVSTTITAPSTVGANQPLAASVAAGSPAVNFTMNVV